MEEHRAAIERAREEVLRYAKELKTLNEAGNVGLDAANVGLDTYLAAVIALEEAETMGLDAANERYKRRREGCRDARDVLENDYNRVELEMQHKGKHAKDKADAAAMQLGATVTTSNEKKPKPSDDKMTKD